MSDPTHDIVEIEKNPVWRVAWIMSECLNDNAPLGWGNYIWVAERVIKSQEKYDV